MLDEIKEECGVAALYWLGKPRCDLENSGHMKRGDDVVALMPQVLLNLQNRGQLAAGLSSYNPCRKQVLDTFKDIGTVNEVFRMSHPAKHTAILEKYAGPAAIGHTRYATCGLDDERYAQPFERHHGRLWKWFTFAFNGNLANYSVLRNRLLSKRDYHFTLDTDTEIIMHMLSFALRGNKAPDLANVMRLLAREFDGAYNITFLDAMGRMFVARDPVGLRPLSYGVKGRLFAAASESVALSNLGFTDIKHLEPGQIVIIENGRMRVHRYAKRKKVARCFFEWVYFSSVGSTMDDSSVYLARARSGAALAAMEDQPVDENSIVVPVPDTAKAAADAFAFAMKIPCVEGLIRNRYVGRTFIQPGATRTSSARYKYTPLPAVLGGKKVFLLEDSIVRSTTLAALAKQLRERGGAKEIHVRVACPPIIAPCFYGIDMSTLKELFAAHLVGKKYNGTPTPKVLAGMAKALGIDSLKYLPVPALAGCIQVPPDSLCTGCVTGKYPTRWGNKLMAMARQKQLDGKEGRTYE